jgi:mRNA-degrading endonuclease RelE of RelBE toxin-antitoxin system
MTYIKLMNSVEYATRAVKQLRKLPAQDGREIRNACDGLAAMPDCTSVKALTNHRYQFRLRVGQYRVFFNYDGAVRIVAIEEVKRRDDHTY